MTRPTQAFRAEHEALLGPIERLRTFARDVPELDVAERRARVEQSLSFLRGTLLPHAAAEERVLYPEWAQLVGFADAASTMVHDHRASAARADQLAYIDVADATRRHAHQSGIWTVMPFAVAGTWLAGRAKSPPDVASATSARVRQMSFGFMVFLSDVMTRVQRRQGLRRDEDHVNPARASDRHLARSAPARRQLVECSTCAEAT